MIKVINTLLAIVGGVGGALVLYWVLNFIAERLPGRWEDRVKPFFYILPAVAALGLYLVYPLIQTIIYSFANNTSSAWVGFKNYTDLLTQRDFQITLVNTLLWIAIAPAVVVALGLAVATLADRLAPRAEQTAKTLIFLPMAVSGVALAAIWRFIYEVRPAGQPQIGLLNAIVTKLGHDPVAWLQLSTGKTNTFLLMVVLIWSQVGFSMVLLSAAIKGVPDETLEAARIDGANERQVFFRIVVPQIWGTVITVFVTTLINVMKIFDIVYVMTGGNFNTNVVAVRFINELITNGNAGRAATIVVILVIAIVPLMLYQVRNFRAQEAAR
ncbi:MAG TPA: sugar ABC transporter permease [Mycobacteriales bacterium]|nr:sugar ABC transporter permease [Mycobacteriales bacterium]